jgi:hypothetical protein
MKTRCLSRLDLLTLVLSFGCLLSVNAADPAESSATQPQVLFDGKTLAGWEGDTNVWRVQDGSITADARAKPLPANYFLVTAEEFGDFRLELEARIEGTGGFVNAGVQVRSQRVPGSTEMSGYQADIGPGYWGLLYDESRRNKILAGQGEAQKLQAVREGDWNRLKVEGRGANLRIWINDALSVDYTEGDPAIPQKGRIGLQIHGQGATLIQYRNIRLTPLAPASR